MGVDAMTPIMTSDKVAELLHCKPETIDTLARERKLPAVKLGGGWVFTAETLVPAISRMIEAATTPPRPLAVKHEVGKPPVLVVG